jgi:hypothetical protein
MVSRAEEGFFFSEEKKQKTFMSLSRFHPEAYAIVIKVFWFFFSKKNCFLILASRSRAFPWQ